MISLPPISLHAETMQLEWGERKLSANLRRTKRRILRIEVQPTGDVIVFAPFNEDLDAIRDRVHRKAAWIFREIDRVANLPTATPGRHFVSGETHLLLGKQYRLSIEEGIDPKVIIDGSRLKILVRRHDDQAHCRRLLTTFYSLTARRVFRDRLDKVAPPFIRKGLRKPPLIIRTMSKRWGSYTPHGRIVLNTDLVRVSPMLIDYVICHELAHAFFRDHGKEWRRMLDSVMPDWEIRKARLEDFLR